MDSGTLYAVKGNRQYTLTAAQAAAYQKDGFDIMDTSGNIVQYGAGKTILYEKHLKELEAVRAECSSGNSKQLKARIKELEEENEALKKRLAEDKFE